MLPPDTVEIKLELDRTDQAISTVELPRLRVYSPLAFRAESGRAKWPRTVG
jgi:hypothetical protein